VNTELDRRLRDFACEQHHVISRSQARRLGAHRDQLAALVALGLWEEATRRVLRRAGTRRTFRQRCMIAALDAGGVVCGETALALWGVPGFPRRGPIRVARLRNGTQRPSALPWVQLTEVRVLPPDQCLRLDGIPVVSPARAVFDIAYRHHWAKVKRALDNTWGMRLTSGRRVHEVGLTWMKRGRAGSAAMRELLKIRPIDYRPADTNLERRFLDILDRAGERLPIPQVDVGDELAWIGRVDFRCDDMPLLVEIQSDRYHVAPLDVAADEARIEALTNAGFDVLPLVEHEVWHDQAEVLRKWREARANCRAKRGTRVRDLHGSSPREPGGDG
jgi:uncharacterized protein DUF559